jgi:hypothetical protein
MTRYIDSSEPVRGSLPDNFVIILISRRKKKFFFSLFIQDSDELRPSTKWSSRRNNIHLNTNNSNNNPTTRIATVKSAKRDNGPIPNVNNYTKEKKENI